MKVIKGEAGYLSCKDNYTLDIKDEGANFYFCGSEAERDMLARMANSIIEHYESKINNEYK